MATYLPPAPGERDPILLRGRQHKMAQSAHAYVRGNTANFYEWLARSPAARRIPQGPAVWICGDCHLGNLGPLANADGRVEIQIRDLDQAVIGNPALDLIRLGLSLATAARGSDLPGVATAHMIEAMVHGYAAALLDPAVHAGPEPDVVRAVRRRALGRRWRHLARERLVAVEPRLPIGRKFWALSGDEQDALHGLFADDGARLAPVLGARRVSGLRLVDAAYWMKGCSSLGLRRFAVIVGFRARNNRHGHALLDLKEATDPIPPAVPHARMPATHGGRVVAAARALSPHLGARMIAADLLGRSFFLRELAPQDLKLEVEQFSEAQGARAAHYLAFVVGRAHARQLDTATRAEWAHALDADRRGLIDAPSWLWDSVVCLAGSHETGYLEHCRQYALAA